MKSIFLRNRNQTVARRRTRSIVFGGLLLVCFLFSSGCFCVCHTYLANHSGFDIAYRSESLQIHANNHEVVEILEDEPFDIIAGDAIISFDTLRNHNPKGKPRQFFVWTLSWRYSLTSDFTLIPQDNCYYLFWRTSQEAAPVFPTNVCIQATSQP